MIRISEAIAHRLVDMTRGQRLLATFVTEHCERAAFMTSFELAGVTGVSQSTVIRFVAQLGFGGFSQFQQALRLELKYRLNIVERFEVMSELPESEDILSAIAMTDAVNIKQTADANRPEALDALATRLILAPRVYVYGQGHAAAAAIYLAGYLGILLPNVCCINLSGLDALSAASNLDSGDALIVISFPPHSRQTLALTEFCKSREAVVAAVSESAGSDTAQLADLAFSAEWGDFGINGSLAPVISLCSAIVCVLAKNDNTAHKKLKNHAEAVQFTEKAGETK